MQSGRSLPAVLGLGALLIVWSANLLPAATLVHAGRLIDGVSDRARANVTVVIEDGRITAVEPGFKSAGDGDTVIDLSDETVLPGLMDMHVHLTGQLSPRNYLERVQLNKASHAVRSVEYARRTLMAGFTTVRNPGDDGTVTVALREEIRKGLVTTAYMPE